MTVIEKEIARCQGLIGTVNNEDLQYALEDRIDVLKMNFCCSDDSSDSKKEGGHDNVHLGIVLCVILVGDF